ncbi:hypothetical protein EYF80_018497 [Liparis tanakae]|uniref:Uncharacterized protein n=1 Tax=Liparis tanakae TaxID=230148 RepID=A0A4Z2I1A0_9TELE|nr:hypothetical protein EYF80_018497 [Liparis tanakae]
MKRNEIRLIITALIHPDSEADSHVATRITAVKCRNHIRVKLQNPVIGFGRNFVSPLNFILLLVANSFSSRRDV